MLFDLSTLTQAQFLRPGLLAKVGVDAARPIMAQISDMTGFPEVFAHLDVITVLFLAWLVVIISFFVLASRCANTSGKPVMSLICAMMGRAASTPTLANRPGRRNCACVNVEPDATSPSPANERNRMPARLLKLPMMKAKAPTYSVFLSSLPTTSSPPMAQNSPASVMSITTSVAVRNATSPCNNPKPESM